MQNCGGDNAESGENIADDPNTEQCMECKKRIPKDKIRTCRRDGWGEQMCSYSLPDDYPNIFIRTTCN